MPRSGPGTATGAPSSRTRPVVGRSSPATMRSSVDFPHPDGPRIVMKSLSLTRSVVGSSARVGAPPRTPGKVRLTPSMSRLGTDGVSAEVPGEETAVRELEQHVRDQSDHPDHDDAENHLA